jgi:hypothetical protein
MEGRHISRYTGSLWEMTANKKTRLSVLQPQETQLLSRRMNLEVVPLPLKVSAEKQDS